VLLSRRGGREGEAPLRASRATPDVLGREAVLVRAVSGVWIESASRYRPPPPGPPGTYRRRLGGGSEAAAAAAAREACLAARAALVVPGGRPLRRPVGVRRGVGEVGAMMSSGQRRFLAAQIRAQSERATRRITAGGRADDSRGCGMARAAGYGGELWRSRRAGEGPEMTAGASRFIWQGKRALVGEQSMDDGSIRGRLDVGWRLLESGASEKQTTRERPAHGPPMPWWAVAASRNSLVRVLFVLG
jgi:hypothetical protein